LHEILIKVTTPQSPGASREAGQLCNRALDANHWDFSNQDSPLPRPFFSAALSALQCRERTALS
jgi:hypothetical protein